MMKNFSSVNAAMTKIPETAAQAVHQPSVPISADTTTVMGYDFNEGNSISDMLQNSYHRMGFQATQLGRAIKVIQQMVRHHLGKNILLF